MAVDNSKLNYYSGWDIDQLIATAEVPISAGTTALYVITTPLPSLPTFEVQFKPTGTNKWFQSGSYATANTLLSSDLFLSYINGNIIYIFAQAGTARYFVWTDKMDY